MEPDVGTQRIQGERPNCMRMAYTSERGSITKRSLLPLALRSIASIDGQEGLHLRRTHGAWVLHLHASPMPADEKPQPVQINLLSAEAKVPVPDTLAQLIQQAG